MINKIPVAELKPCPFCGSISYLFIGTANDISGNDDEESIAVCCDFSKGGCGSSGGYRLSREKAIEAWNRRVEQ